MPFYIGLGKKRINRLKDNSKISAIYERAYSKSRRSDIWLALVKTTEYDVEILFETDSYDEACLKEIEFIGIHGRLDLKSGSLVNLTDGSNTNGNYIYPQERLYKLSENMKGNKLMLGRKIPKDVTEKRIKSIQKSVIQCDIHGNKIKEWVSAKIASETGFNTGHISSCCKGKRKSHGGFIWKYKNN